MKKKVIGGYKLPKRKLNKKAKRFLGKKKKKEAVNKAMDEWIIPLPPKKVVKWINETMNVIDNNNFQFIIANKEDFGLGMYAMWTYVHSNGLLK